MGKEEHREAYKEAAGPGRENVDKEADAYANQADKVDRGEK